MTEASTHSAFSFEMEFAHQHSVTNQKSFFHNSLSALPEFDEDCFENHQDSIEGNRGQCLKRKENNLRNSIEAIKLTIKRL